MALIGKIRKNFWLMVVLLALGLGGFVLMDMFTGDKSIFGSSQNTMGEIAGRKVDYGEFNQLENVLYSGSASDVFARRNSLWNYFVEETLVNQEGEALGLGVSKQELIDLQFGDKLSPIISQRFVNPNTGQVDRTQLNNIKQAIESNTLQPSLRQYWAHQEKEIMKDRLQEKMTNLISKSLYTPTWMLDQVNKEVNQKSNFEYVKVAFDQIEDTAINLADADYEQYLNDNVAVYKSDEETRKMAYVAFDVQPTKEDSTNYYNRIAELKTPFADSNNDSIFVDNNYGSIAVEYYLKDVVSAAIKDTVFDLPVGSVYGPYIDEDKYKLVKIRDRKVIADSVKSRHILRAATNPVEYQAAQKTIDSLKALIIAGTHQFDSLAMKFSQGPSGPKGGDLPMSAPGGMVKEFNDLIFYTAEPNKVYSVVTQFGVHLVEVEKRVYETNKTGVQLAFVEEPIVPSEETQTALLAKANEFIASNRTYEDLVASAEADPNLTLETTASFKRNDYFIPSIGQGQTSRDIIRWSFGSDEIGAVSPEVYIQEDPVRYFNSKYFVGCLNSIQAKGTPSLANIKDQLQVPLMNQKKGEMLAGKIAGMDMSSIVSSYSGERDTISNASFSSRFLGSIGNEPKVIANAMRLNENETSQAIVGTNGVYIIKVLSKSDAPASTNIPQLRKQAKGNIEPQIRTGLLSSLKKNANISDNRFKFY